MNHSAPADGDAEPVEVRVRKLHEASIVIDASNVAVVLKTSVANPADRPIAEEFFDKMLAGGVTASNVTVPQSVDAGMLQSIREVDEHRQWIDRSAEKALLVQHAADIESAKSQQKAAVILGPQNANILEDRVEAVQMFHTLGVRIMQLTYNKRNLIGDGCLERTDAGLSDFGAKVVEAMNACGIVVDLSHSGDQTTMDAIECSELPVVFTHANARAVCDHPRNKTDEQIEALAAGGGVICATPYAPFVRLREEGKLATIDDFVAHIKHIERLVGVDHIGIGTDINEINETRRIWLRGLEAQAPSAASAVYRNYPDGFDGDLRNFRVLTSALAGAGYSDDAVKKMLGGNLLRVFRQWWGG